MIELPPVEIPQDPPVPPDPGLDPDAATGPETGLFGLGLAPERARFLALPVPYQATVSSRGGTIDGPRALVDASCQLDLYDFALGEPWRHGFAALEESCAVRELSGKVAGLVARMRAGDASVREEVDHAGDRLAEWLADAVDRMLEGGWFPIVLGGEHGVSRGAFAAAARRHPGLGILQIDAHADLRHAFEGLRSSHASVMRRALELDGVSRLVQVGLRDVGREEVRVIETEERVVAFPDHRLAASRLEGRGFSVVAESIVAALPEKVWISVDVDGLDPSLCPGTGTPVPGGLGWDEINHMIDLLAHDDVDADQRDVVMSQEVDQVVDLVPSEATGYRHAGSRWPRMGRDQPPGRSPGS